VKNRLQFNCNSREGERGRGVAKQIPIRENDFKADTGTVNKIAFWGIVGNRFRLHLFQDKFSYII
jgi:hypothetical protein